MKHQREINELFDCLVKALYKKISDFGETLAIDGKAIKTYAKPRRNKDKKPYDGRRDIDADFRVKTYKGKTKDGSLWEKTKNR